MTSLFAGTNCCNYLTFRRTRKPKPDMKSRMNNHQCGIPYVMFWSIYGLAIPIVSHNFEWIIWYFRELRRHDIVKHDHIIHMCPSFKQYSILGSVHYRTIKWYYYLPVCQRALDLNNFKRFNEAVKYGAFFITHLI